MTECSTCPWWTDGWGEERRARAHTDRTEHNVVTVPGIDRGIEL